ncbi:MAG TPA: hypothetical protein VM122_12285 [Usitatibacter sp.]|nr:hypothetical protein [Usitatibacter sp.]
MFLRLLGRGAAIASIACAFAQHPVLAAQASSPAMSALGDSAPGQRVPYMFNPTPSDYRVPPAADYGLQQKAMKALQATVVVNYLPPGTSRDGDNCIAWSAPAQAAFSHAASLWAAQLRTPVPITIDACFSDSLDPGVLGQAGAYTNLRNFTNAPAANTWFPVALANAIAGTDLRPADPDIYAAFSSTFSWYYGTDGRVPPGTLDFMSVVMHEIGHGLGFAGTMDISGGSGSWGLGSGYPFRFDRFTENGTAQALLNTAVFPNPSAALASALQSNAVYFNGPNANAGNGGARVPLFAPTRWSDGSSYSHLAESFNRTPNALMTFSLSSGEAIHDPGPVALGVLKDLGWPLQDASTADVALSQAASANPASTGKDEVFTATVTNNGPGTATGIAVTMSYDPSATVIWVTPGCTKQGSAATYVCSAGSLANGAKAQFNLVLRKAATGSVSSNATVTSATSDPDPANNSAATAVSVVASPAAKPVLRYRLYSPVTREHHFTTDANEYAVLGALAGTWVAEGTAGKVLDNPGVFNGVTAVPYYRLYGSSSQQHHWTSDANEYYTLLMSPAWQGEGVDGYVLPTATTGTTPLYRLNYPFVAGLHHWTIDGVEYSTLVGSYGWIGEGGAGHVIR